MTIPFFFGLKIDLVALFIFIFTMVVLTEVIKAIIRFIVCAIIERKVLHNAYSLDWMEELIEKDSFKLLVSVICGFTCFYFIAKYGNKIPITDGSKIDISALTIIQFLIFTGLTCGGYKLLKPVFNLIWEYIKVKFLKKNG